MNPQADVLITHEANARVHEHSFPDWSKNSAGDGASLYSG